MTASQMTLEAIRSVPLFASLDDEAADRIAQPAFRQDRAAEHAPLQTRRQGRRHVSHRERTRAHQHSRRR